MTNIFSAVCISTCLLYIGVCGDEMMQLSKRQTPSTCTGGYEKVQGSTMCLTDSSDYIPGTAGVSAAEKATILQVHNQFRASTNPTASTMPKLYWNDELAKVAEKWAKQCHVDHEENFGKSRLIPAYGETPGQNAAGGQQDWTAVITGWHSEVDIFQYGKDRTTYLDDSQMIGHYTQVVQEGAVLVGCGYAKCTSGYQRIYICNYLRGNYQISKPYTSGTPCSGCLDKCDADSKKLCDCGGKFCLNKGTLDPNTCQCTCTAIYAGDTCQTLKCPVNEPSKCGKPQPYGYPKSFCPGYTNVPIECPIMCEICPVPCAGKKCQNGGQLDDATSCTCKCTDDYKGTNCETRNCKGDLEVCPQFPKTYCAETHVYKAYMSKNCPAHCGLC